MHGRLGGFHELRYFMLALWWAKVDFLDDPRMATDNNQVWAGLYAVRGYRRTLDG